jgi:hypothetical protein
MVNDLTKTVFGSNLHKSFKLSHVLAELNKLNLLNSGELAERAISMKSGIEQCTRNTPEIDLVSGVQIKHAQTSFSKSNPKQQKAFISIKGTKAPILAVITERITGAQYFLNIPYKARRHLTGNTISICFDQYGNPGKSQWWEYEVDSFKTLCEMAKC